MKYYSVFLSCLFLILLLSYSSSSQVYAPTPAQNEIDVAGLRAQRYAQIRDDVLEDISLFGPKDQATYYARLGEEFWSINKLEGARWLTKGVEIALSPGTDYENSKERIDVLSYVLISNDVLGKDAILGRRLLAEITGILFEEVKANGSDEYSGRLAYLAAYLFKYDQQQAFDLAILSLKVKKFNVSAGTSNLFRSLKDSSEDLASQYIAKLLEVIRTTSESDEEKIRAIFYFEVLFEPFKGSGLSDSQKRAFLDVVAQFIRNESDELVRQTRNRCALVFFGTRYMASYKKLLPERIAVIKHAMDVCETLGNWNRLAQTESPRASQYYLDLAKATGDEVKKARYLFPAAAIARKNRQYGLAISILDQIGQEQRSYQWDTSRVQLAESLVVPLLRNGRTAEIKEIIRSAPQVLRPYIIIRATVWIPSSRDKNKQFIMNLLNEARAEIKKKSFAIPSKTRFGHIINPAMLIVLVDRYYRFQYEDEALEVFSDYVDLLNQLSRRFTYKDQNGATISYFYYYTIPNRMLVANFESIYLNVGRIESLRMRVEVRLNLLRDYKTTGYRGGRGGQLGLDY